MDPNDLDLYGFAFGLVLSSQIKKFLGWSVSVGVNVFGIIGSTPKNSLFGFTHFFTDVIQVIFGHS